MPKQMLSGTLDEQCAFLFDLAQQKAAVGNFAGASHALKEILKHRPAYPGAQELLVHVKAGRRQQRTLLWFSLAGAIVAIFLGTLWELPNDLWFLAMGAVGAIAGFLVGNLVVGIRSPRPTPGLTAGRGAAVNAPTESGIAGERNRTTEEGGEAVGGRSSAAGDADGGLPSSAEGGAGGE